MGDPGIGWQGRSSAWGYVIFQYFPFISMYCPTFVHEMHFWNEDQLVL